MNKKELIKITSVFLVFIFSYTCLVAIVSSNHLAAQSILPYIAKLIVWVSINFANKQF